MLGDCNENIWALKLNVGKEIYMDVYNQIVLQIIILIEKNKFYCTDFYLDRQLLK